MKKYFVLLFLFCSFFTTQPMGIATGSQDSDDDIFYSCKEGPWSEELSYESDSDNDESFLDKLIVGEKALTLKKTLSDLRHSLSHHDFINLDSKLSDKNCDAITTIVNFAHAFAVREGGKYCINKTHIKRAIQKHGLRVSRFFYN